MRFSAVTTLATLGFAGISSANRGFLQSCHDLGLSHFNGALRVDAKCVDGHDVMQSTHLDLDKCFGWSGANCGFTFPPARYDQSSHVRASLLNCRCPYQPRGSKGCRQKLIGLSCSGIFKSVDIEKCQNPHTGDNDFGNSFGQSYYITL